MVVEPFKIKQGYIILAKCSIDNFGDASLEECVWFLLKPVLTLKVPSVCVSFGSDIDLFIFLVLVGSYFNYLPKQLFMEFSHYLCLNMGIFVVHVSRNFDDREFQSQVVAEALEVFCLPLVVCSAVWSAHRNLRSASTSDCCAVFSKTQDERVFNVAMLEVYSEIGNTVNVETRFPVCE